MSRACMTLFIGYHHHHPSVVAKDVSLLKIKGLPDHTSSGFPNFLHHQQHEDSPTPKKTNVSCLLNNCFIASTTKRPVHKKHQTTEHEQLVQKLAEQLNQIATTANKEEMCFTVRRKVTLKHENETARADLMMFLETRQRQKKSALLNVPLGLLEVGLLPADQDTHGARVREELDKMFWEKTGQGIKYLNFVQEDVKWKWKDPDPVLMGVLVATRNCNMGRLAIFLCEPKENGKGKRIALLWRSEFQSRQELSTAFGLYVNGLAYLSKEKANLTNNTNIVWEYLGPNCAKVVTDSGQEYTLRSYDNRVRQTSRSPRVYKSWHKLKDVTRPVLLVKDNESDSKTFEFAAHLDAPELNDESILFSKWNRADSKGGKVEVIAVPFIKDGHRCSRTTKQALFLARYMQEFHKDGVVHGDIRGLNIVFKDDSDEAYFMDWDFGGHVDIDKPRYPVGYQVFLDDGRRFVHPMARITVEDDVEALAYFLGYLHRPLEPTPDEIIVLRYQLEASQNMEGMIASLEKMEKSGSLLLRTFPPYENYLTDLARAETGTDKYGGKGNSGEA